MEGDMYCILVWMVGVCYITTGIEMQINNKRMPIP